MKKQKTRTTEDKRLLVALSAGGVNKELAKRGIGVEHVEELMVRIAMRLLSAGHRLSFGGTLGVADQPLTKQLIETAQRWLSESTAQDVDITAPETWPLVNFSPWPYYQYITPEQRARLVGICQFVDVKPPGLSDEQLKDLADAEKSQRDRYCADALTSMRELSAEQSDLRIVWAGKIQGASGWMAGILEEVISSLSRQRPILILGGFGGCAGVIADFLRDPDSEWPEALGLSACANEGRDGLLSRDELARLFARMEDATRQLTDYRSELHVQDQIGNVPSNLLLSALGEDSPRAAINLAAATTRAFVTPD